MAMQQFEPRGTVHASLFGATEGVLLLAAAVESVLIAGLALLLSRVGIGSVVGALFLRLNDLLLGPFGLLYSSAGGAGATIGRQAVAVFGYGLFFLLIIGGVSWLDRRHVFY
ncbi:MAG TPA: hypothetical protein VIL85_04475 [Thermomicrobiales bacterium]